MQSVSVRVGFEVSTVAPVSPRVGEVAAMFGLGVDERRTVTVIPPTELTLRPGEVTFVTGSSGGGKTTLLRQIRDRLHADHPHVRVIELHGASPLDREADGPAIVERIGGTFEQAMRWLALAGLNEAFVMLRRLGELSDGQRARYRLAEAIAAAETIDPDAPAGWTVVLADEFGATLDRRTARTIARQVRRWVTRSTTAEGNRPAAELPGTKIPGAGFPGVCFVGATTHDDLLEPLDPDWLVVQHPGGRMDVHRRVNHQDTKDTKRMTESLE